MCAVEFLLALFARCVEVRAINGNHVIAAVGRGVENGLMLPHEGEGYRRGHAAKRTWISADVYEVPGAGIGETCLVRVVSRSSDINVRSEKHTLPTT